MYTRVCTLLVCLLSAVKKSEPLSRHAYVISVEALPCSAPNRSRLTCSGSPSPIISHGCGGCVCVCVCVDATMTKCAGWYFWVYALV